MKKKILCFAVVVLMLMGVTVSANDNAYLFFAADGGRSVEFLKVPCGTTVNLNEYVPEKIGYEFEGWYDSPVDTANRLGEITVWDKTVVCAKWKLAEGTSERLLELDILSRDVVGNNVVFQTVDNEVKIVPVTDLWVEQNARLEALMKINNELYNR